MMSFCASYASRFLYLQSNSKNDNWRFTHTHTQRFIGHFPGTLELAGFSVDSQSLLIRILSMFVGQAKILHIPSDTTHQLLFGYPLCLVHSFSISLHHFTQSVSFMFSVSKTSYSVVALVRPISTVVSGVV